MSEIKNPLQMALCERCGQQIAGDVWDIHSCTLPEQSGQEVCQDSQLAPNRKQASQPQSLPFGVGGGLVAIKTLLSRDPCVHANTAIEMLDAILAEQPAQQHSDDVAVDRFAGAMKAKMAKQRVKGYGGWDDPAACPTERLQQMLVAHISKGDPLDVANFAMMLWNRGERTEQPAQQQEPPDGYVVVARAVLKKLGIDDDVIDTIAGRSTPQPAQRCPLCNYQHGHAIGCKNNPVDIAIAKMAAQPAQEPVAWLDPEGEDDCNVITAAWKRKLQAMSTRLEQEHAAKHTVPVYTPPPEQRKPWVGLTDARGVERAHGIYPKNSDCHGPDWTDRDGEYLK